MSAPYLILAAFWQDSDNTADVAAVLRTNDFPPPEGWPRGAVVSFRREVATAPEFRRTLRQLDLAELNVVPRGGSE